jgi:hypothetical protein
MSDLVETSHYDEASDSLVVKTTFDSSAVIAANRQAQNDAPETGRYKGNLAHVGRIHMGDIVRLKNEGFNLLSPDPDEVKRALLHIQSNEKYLLTVPGTPIAKRRQSWA